MSKMNLKEDEYDIYQFEVPSEVIKDKSFFELFRKKQKVLRWVNSQLEKCHPCFCESCTSDIHLFIRSGKLCALATVMDKITLSEKKGFRNKNQLHVEKPFSRFVFVNRSRPAYYALAPLLLLVSLLFVRCLSPKNDKQKQAGSESNRILSDAVSQIVFTDEKTEEFQVCLNEFYEALSEKGAFVSKLSWTGNETDDSTGIFAAETAFRADFVPLNGILLFCINGCYPEDGTEAFEKCFESFSDCLSAKPKEISYSINNVCAFSIEAELFNAFVPFAAAEASEQPAKFRRLFTLAGGNPVAESEFPAFFQGTIESFQFENFASLSEKELFGFYPVSFCVALNEAGSESSSELCVSAEFSSSSKNCIPLEMLVSKKAAVQRSCTFSENTLYSENFVFPSRLGKIWQEDGTCLEFFKNSEGHIVTSVLQNHSKEKK